MSTSKGLNKVMVIGWLEDEPEVRQTPGGRAVASFSVATSRSWTTSEGEKHEEKEWFNVIAWGNLAEMCRERLAKEDSKFTLRVVYRPAAGKIASAAGTSARKSSPKI